MKKKSYFIVVLIAVSGMLFIGYHSFRQAAPALTATPTPFNQQQAIVPTESAPTQIPLEDVVRLVWFYKPPEEGQLDLVGRHFDFFILTHKDEAARDQFREEGITVPFSQYLLFLVVQDPGDCDEGPRGNQVAYKDGDFCQISEIYPDWFLLDQNGNRIKAGSDTYHMDPGSEGFRAFWLERARELQEIHGWEDIFLDNVEATRTKMVRDGKNIPKYPDDESYARAVEGFLAYIRQNYFEPQGKSIYGNIVSLDEEEVWDRYLQHLDGAMVESFATDWSDGYRDRDDWEEQMVRVEGALAQGKTMILVAQGEQDDLELQNLAYASYLLIANGNAVFRYTDSEAYRELWWYENYDLDLGAPLGERYEDKGGWRRDFANGQVFVHPGSNKSEIVVNP
jgi:hypothetical protein